MKSLSIVGYGGFGKEIEYLIRNKFKGIKIDVFDDFDKSINVNPIQNLLNIKVNTNCIIAIGNPVDRMNIHSLLKINSNIIFPNIFFSDFKAYPFSDENQLGIGNIIMPDVMIGFKSKIGSFNLIGSRVTLGHDVELGNYNFLGPNCFLAGSVKVKDNCKFSFGTSFVQRATVTSNINTMPNSVVYKKLKISGTYSGNPCKLIFR